MNDKIIWHPKYSIYNFIKKGVMLVSDDRFYWLPESKYRGASLIDGNNRLTDIIDIISTRSPQSPVNCVQFMHQTNQLKRAGLLVDDSELLLQYNIPNMNIEPELDISHNIEVMSLSSVAESYLKQWRTLLLALDLEGTKLSTNQMVMEGTNTIIRFILVDELLDERIQQVLAVDRHCCVIKISGNELAITPLFETGEGTKAKYSIWQQIQTTLYRNKPVRRFLTQLLPWQAHAVPIINQDPLPSEQWRIIKRLLLSQLQGCSFELLCYQIDRKETTQHPLHVHASRSNQTPQFELPIILKHSQAAFNKDGGTRTVTATQTVERLMSFVDNITGSIAYIEQLEPDSDSLIKIYRTGFYKTPPISGFNKLDENSFVQICLGKGVTPEQSQASALCEAIERSNAQFHGDEPLYTARPSDLTIRHLHFQHLSPYSQAQYQQFSDSNNSESKRIQAVKPYNNEPIHWIKAWSLTHEEHVNVPLTCCFTNIDLPQNKTEQHLFGDIEFGRWHSNGAAAGNTLEEAILQALFELIERDATAIWWYNRIPRPAFDLSKIDAEYYQPLKQTLSNEHHFWVLDVTNDIGIPVMVAVGKHKQSGGYIFGFGCHLQANLAAQRALTELCQLIPIRNQPGAPFNFDDIVEGPHLHPHDTLDALAPFANSTNDLKVDILAIVSQLKRHNFETLVLDYSRDPIPLHTVKVFVPGLCHIWPQLANERLYQVPVNLHWLETANNENSINQHELYI